MMQNYKIDRKNLPSKMPVSFTLISILAMDYWGAPDWVFGAVGVFLLLFWVSFFISVSKSKYIDIFENKEKSTTRKSTAFKERLEKAKSGLKSN